MPEFLATDGPIVFSFQGKSYNIPQAVIGDYGPWLAELHTKRKASLTKLVPVAQPPAERFKMLRQIELDEPTHWTLLDELAKPDGTERVLKIVLPKSGMDADTVKAVLTTLSANEQYKLACYASGLVPPGRLALMFGVTQQEVEQQTMQMLGVFAKAMQTAGIDAGVQEAVLLNLPGVTRELLAGEVTQPATADKPATFAGNV